MLQDLQSKLNMCILINLMFRILPQPGAIGYPNMIDSLHDFQSHMNKFTPKGLEVA